MSILGSLDNSIAEAEQLGAVTVQLDLGQPFTAARARNEGFKTLMSVEPSTRFVQFIDGDCELVPTWLDAALRFIANREDVAVVCGRRRELYPERSLYNKLCDIEWNTPIGEALACGGDALMRVEPFQEVGGFRSNLIANEEPELCVRLRQKGWKIWRLDAEMTCHDAAITKFNQWWARAVRSGYGDTEISWLYLNDKGQTKEKRAVASAMLWAGLLPVAIVVGAFFHPVFLFAALVYPVQVTRIAINKSPGSIASWVYAAFIMLAKFAQLWGALKYVWYHRRRQQLPLIEYKNLN